MLQISRTGCVIRENPLKLRKRRRKASGIHPRPLSPRHRIGNQPDRQAADQQLALVTIDAVDCQVATAVVSPRLTIALKGNQATLESDVKSYFGDAPTNELVTRPPSRRATGAS